MSSTYRVLCLSHDPAIVAADPGYHRREQAEEAIRVGIEEHPDCDLLIGRYSYPLIEVGCPPHHTSHHGGTEWVDSDWLRLLAAAYQSQDEAVRAATRQSEFRCWSWERLRRLRDELGIAQRGHPPDEVRP